MTQELLDQYAEALDDHLCDPDDDTACRLADARLDLLDAKPTVSLSCKWPDGRQRDIVGELIELAGELAYVNNDAGNFEGFATTMELA